MIVQFKKYCKQKLLKWKYRNFGMKGSGVSDDFKSEIAQKPHSVSLKSCERSFQPKQTWYLKHKTTGRTIVVKDSIAKVIADYSDQYDIQKPMINDVNQYWDEAGNM